MLRRVRPHLRSPFVVGINGTALGLHRAWAVHLLDATVGTSAMPCRYYLRLLVFAWSKLLHGPFVRVQTLLLAGRPWRGVLVQFKYGKALILMEKSFFRVILAEELVDVLVAQVVVLLGLDVVDVAYATQLVRPALSEPQIFVLIMAHLILIQVSLDPDLLYAFLQVLPGLRYSSAELDILVLRLGPDLTFWLMYL